MSVFFHNPVVLLYIHKVQLRWPEQSKTVKFWVLKFYPSLLDLHSNEFRLVKTDSLSKHILQNSIERLIKWLNTIKLNEVMSSTEDELICFEEFLYLARLSTFLSLIFVARDECDWRQIIAKLIIWRRTKFWKIWDRENASDSSWISSFENFSVERIFLEIDLLVLKKVTLLRYWAIVIDFHYPVF